MLVNIYCLHSPLHPTPADMDHQARHFSLRSQVASSPFWTQHSEEPLYPEYVGSWYGVKKYRVKWVQVELKSWSSFVANNSEIHVIYFVWCLAWRRYSTGILLLVTIRYRTISPSFYLFNHQVGNFQTTLDGWYKKKKHT